MQLKIERDRNGVVTITDPNTGRSETQETHVAHRPATVNLERNEELPAHMFGRIA